MQKKHDTSQDKAQAEELHNAKPPYLMMMMIMMVTV